MDIESKLVVGVPDIGFREQTKRERGELLEYDVSFMFVHKKKMDKAKIPST